MTIFLLSLKFPTIEKALVSQMLTLPSKPDTGNSPESFGYQLIDETVTERVRPHSERYCKQSKSL